MSEEKKCKKCSKTSSYKHIGVIVLGTYVLFATIYGSIEIVKDIKTSKETLQELEAFFAV